MNKDETDLLKMLVGSVSKQSGGGVGDEFHEDIKNFKNRVWVEVAQLQERLSTIEKLNKSPSRSSAYSTITISSSSFDVTSAS